MTVINKFSLAILAASAIRGLGQTGISGDGSGLSSNADSKSFTAMDIPYTYGYRAPNGEWRNADCDAGESPCDCIEDQSESCPDYVPSPEHYDKHLSKQIFQDTAKDWGMQRPYQHQVFGKHSFNHNLSISNSSKTQLQDYISSLDTGISGFKTFREDIVRKKPIALALETVFLSLSYFQNYISHYGHHPSMNGNKSTLTFISDPESEDGMSSLESAQPNLSSAVRDHIERLQSIRPDIRIVESAPEDLSATYAVKLFVVPSFIPEITGITLKGPSASKVIIASHQPTFEKQTVANLFLNKKIKAERPFDNQVKTAIHEAAGHALGVDHHINEHNDHILRELGTCSVMTAAAETYDDDSDYETCIDSLFDTFSVYVAFLFIQGSTLFQATEFLDTPAFDTETERQGFPYLILEAVFFGIVLPIICVLSCLRNRSTSDNDERVLDERIAFEAENGISPDD